MRSAVYIGVLVFIVVCQAVDYGARSLRCGTVIQPDQSAAVDFLRQDRKIRADLGKGLASDPDGIIPGSSLLPICLPAHSVSTQRSRRADLPSLLFRLAP